jgi:dodecin
LDVYSELFDSDLDAVAERLGKAAEDCAELLRRVTGSSTVATAMVAPKPRGPRSEAMNGHVYGLSEIVGTSAQGVDDAIRVGIQRAARTVRGLDWFEVTDIRGHLVDGEIEHFQVTMKIGFRMEDPKQT